MDDKMKGVFNKVIFIFLLFVPIVIVGQDSGKQESDIVKIEDLQKLVGEWEGTITYIDYQSKKPFTMPANLIVTKTGNDSKLKLSNIYPKEPKANSTEKLIVSKDGRTVNKKKISKRVILENGEIRITTEYQGKDDNQEATIRNIYLISAKEYISSKEVKFAGSDEWILRSEYKYNRKEKLD